MNPFFPFPFLFLACLALAGCSSTSSAGEQQHSASPLPSVASVVRALPSEAPTVHAEPRAGNGVTLSCDKNGMGMIVNTKLVGYEVLDVKPVEFKGVRSCEVTAKRKSKGAEDAVSESVGFEGIGTVGFVLFKEPEGEVQSDLTYYYPEGEVDPVVFVSSFCSILSFKGVNVGVAGLRNCKGVYVDPAFAKLKPEDAAKALFCIPQDYSADMSVEGVFGFDKKETIKRDTRDYTVKTSGKGCLTEEKSGTTLTYVFTNPNPFKYELKEETCEVNMETSRKCCKTNVKTGQPNQEKFIDSCPS